jgi:hypothetical protein
MRNFVGSIPTLKNPNFDSRNVASSESVETFMNRAVAQSAAEACQACVARIGDLGKRHQAAKDFIARLKPTEKVAEFGAIPSAEVLSRKELEALETDRQAFVEKLEARAEQLERERVANLPEIEKLRLELRAELNVLAGRLARLERGETAALAPSLAPRSRADIPQILIPNQRDQRGAGLGGVSASFGRPAPSSAGGVRKVGR